MPQCVDGFISPCTVSRAESSRGHGVFCTVYGWCPNCNCCTCMIHRLRFRTATIWWRNCTRITTSRHTCSTWKVLSGSVLQDRFTAHSKITRNWQAQYCTYRPAARTTSASTAYSGELWEYCIHWRVVRVLHILKSCKDTADTDQLLGHRNYRLYCLFIAVLCT